MQLKTLQHRNGCGWSEKVLSDLDSENTLVLNFFSPEYINNSEPFETLKKALTLIALSER